MFCCTCKLNPSTTPLVGRVFKMYRYYNAVSVASVASAVHAQCLTDGRIAADAPDFRVEVVMNKSVTPQERNAELYSEGLRVRNSVPAFQTDVAENLSWPLVNQSKKNAEANIIEKPAADQLSGA